MYWSKNKEGKFVKMYPHHTDENLAKIMGVPYGFVKRKAEELGLVKQEEEKHEWTQKDIDYLLSNYADTDNETLANAIGVEKFQVEHRAYRLGLRKSRSYMSNMIGNEGDGLVDKWFDEWNQEMGCSKGHYVLYKIVQHIFSFHKVEEEVKIGNLRIDIAVPYLKLAFEYHGIQHSNFSGFYHKTKNDFVKGQENDWKKSEMLESLDFSLIVVYHDEDLSIGLVKQKLEEVI